MSAKLENIQSFRVDGVPLSIDPPSIDRVERSVASVLEQTGLCAWATVTARCEAHVNIGYFAESDDWHFYLLSHPRSLHCRNVAVNASMALGVFTSPQNWTDPGLGIQFFGTCKVVSDSETDEAQRIYGRRYPAFGEWKSSLKRGDLALDYRFYRFIPDQLKVLDEVEFGDAVFIRADVLR